MDAKEFSADFETVDDLLWAATTKQLAAKGVIRILAQKRVGPLVELTQARRLMPNAYSQVGCENPATSSISAALDRGQISGTSFGSTFGVLPLSCRKNAGQDDTYELWKVRMEKAAEAINFPASLAQALLGALGELEDNINLHSEKAASGILVYSTDSGMLEFVVSDTGIGVLESLRKNSEFSTLNDSGTALSIAIADGNSRFDRTSGHGLGIGQLFRALAGYEGEVRFRSGDHALTLSGRNPGQNGTLKLARKANLAGLTISVICGTPRLPSR